MILTNYASAPIRKERLSPTSEGKKEASRNEFMEKGGMPDRVKSFREINSGEDSRDVVMSSDWERVVAKRMIIRKSYAIGNDFHKPGLHQQVLIRV